MSTLYVDNLQPNLGSRVMAAGHVVQVVSAETNSQVQNTTTSYIDTGLTATITPTSASSKIAILLNVFSRYSFILESIIKLVNIFYLHRKYQKVILNK